jgi:hypothetical protein
LFVTLVNGEPGGDRTRDHRIKSAMLYQLSYRPEYFIIKQLIGFRELTNYMRALGGQSEKPAGYPPLSQLHKP